MQSLLLSKLIFLDFKRITKSFNILGRSYLPLVCNCCRRYGFFYNKCCKYAIDVKSLLDNPSSNVRNVDFWYSLSVCLQSIAYSCFATR